MWVHACGGVRVVNLDQKLQELISIFLFSYYSTLGQVFTTKLLSIKDQHRTAEGSPSDDDSYLGYSGSDFVFKFSLNSLKFSLTRETGTQKS